MLDAFRPQFDADDGSFWMSYEDFFKYFESLTFCKVDNWRELRLKGKFIRVQEEQNPGNDWVISQFFYTFNLHSPTQIHIGLHQEDERIIGAEKRPYLDLSYVILKRSDEGDLSVAGIADHENDRDLEAVFNLDEGHYIVIPRTTGGLLKKFENDDLPAPIRINMGGKRMFNPKIYSTLNDIFRKIDLQLDGILTSKELNAFGDIVDEPFFQNLTQDSFSSREFENIS